MVVAPVEHIASRKPSAAAVAPVLDVRDLMVEFTIPGGVVQAVNGVSYTLRPGETLGVVGESGSGKSVTALSVLRLLPMPPAGIRGGQILFSGEDLLQLPIDRMRQIRGNKISMIFQEPMTSLNPVMTIGDQVAEVFRLHRSGSRAGALEQAEHMLNQVRIPAPRQRLSEYPHQLSGGMRQRVMIAMALACRPQVLLADEPTTALDVTIQAQIVELMSELQKSYGTSVVLISHNMGLIADICDRVVVMYAGQVVEEGPVADLFIEPLHPYTQALLRSIPRLRTSKRQKRVKRLETIEGVVPDLSRLPEGCVFRSRCPHAMPVCAQQGPALTDMEGTRRVRCWLHEEPAAA